MSAARPLPSPAIPPLKEGDRLSRDEFERRYSAMPHVNKAELIEGVVYMPSPVRFDIHGGPHADLMWWLGHYRAFTPGLISGDNTTVRLDLDNVPQPDAFLAILEQRGGQAIMSGGYIEGAPELVSEVSGSTSSIDLNAKKTAYRRNGVKEYLVWRVLDQEVDWFLLKGSDYARLTPDASGILKSEVFPGLWLKPAALFQGDLPAVLAVLQQGLTLPDHAAFVQKLAKADGEE